MRYTRRSQKQLPEQLTAKADVVFKIYVLVKPTEERILYKSLDGAAAGQQGSEVEEWHAFDGQERMQLIRLWGQRRTGVVSGLADIAAITPSTIS